MTRAKIKLHDHIAASGKTGGKRLRTRLWLPLTLLASFLCALYMVALHRDAVLAVGAWFDDGFGQMMEVVRLYLHQWGIIKG